MQPATATAASSPPKRSTARATAASSACWSRTSATTSSATPWPRRRPPPPPGRRAWPAGSRARGRRRSGRSAPSASRPPPGLAGRGADPSGGAGDDGHGPRASSAPRCCTPRPLPRPARSRGRTITWRGAEARGGLGPGVHVAQAATACTRSAVRAASSRSPSAALAPPGRRARRWATPPPRRPTGARAAPRPAAGCRPARPRRGAPTPGASASSSDVSVRPAWASPPVTWGNQASARPALGPHGGHRPPERPRVPGVPRHQHHPGEGVGRAHQLDHHRLQCPLADRERAGEPGVLAARPVGQGGRHHHVRTGGRQPLGQSHGHHGVGRRAAGGARAAPSTRAAPPAAAAAPPAATSRQPGRPTAGGRPADGGEPGHRSR